jgi:hypothetical protein
MYTIIITYSKGGRVQYTNVKDYLPSPSTETFNIVVSDSETIYIPFSSVVNVYVKKNESNSNTPAQSTPVSNDVEKVSGTVE